MDDSESLIIRPRDYSDIACLQDPNAQEFLDEPLTFVAETITGAWNARRLNRRFWDSIVLITTRLPAPCPVKGIA